MKQLIKLLIVLTFCTNAIGQIVYQHDFGTTTIPLVSTYTVPPSVIVSGIDLGSTWTTSSVVGFTNSAGFGGGGSQALTLSNSSGTPTYSLNLSITPGYTLDLSSFSFWRQRSGTGAQTWTLAVNNATTIGSGSTPTTGVNTGTIAVSSPVTGLTGNVTVVLQISGATGAGSFRLDDFTLYGLLTTSIVCTTPTIQATSLTYANINNTSVDLNWISGNGNSVIVFANQSSTVIPLPVNGNNYTANSVFGLGQQLGTNNFAVYNGVGNSVTVTGLQQGTDYKFSVFEYNNVGNCYLSPGISSSVVTTQTSIPSSNCLQIKRVLVDACQANATNYESYNEMVYFKNGNNPLPIDQLSISGAGSGGNFVANKWPNNSNIWNGLIQNATTASNVSAINASISKCGVVIEPPQILGIGIIPPNANVILVGNQIMNPTSNSFANLTDTVYMIFQAVSTTTSGNFVNGGQGATGTRYLVLVDNLNSCTSNTVSYQPTSLVGNDGDGIAYDDIGAPTYYNSGCSAPFTPLSINAGNNQTICKNSTTIFSASTSGVYNSLTWLGGSGTFSNPSSLTTTYTPGAGEIGTITLTCAITRSCASTSYSISDVVSLTIHEAPTPIVSSTSPTLCSNQTATLSFSVSNSSVTGITTQTWLPSNATALTQTVNAANIYTIDVSNICGSNSSTVQISAIPNASVSISASGSTTLCAPNSVTLTATSNVGNFSWTGGVTTNTFVANTTSTVVVTSTNVCNTAAASQTIDVTPLPTLTVSPNNVGICNSNSALLSANTNTTVSYIWSSASNTNIATTQTVSLNTGGVYTVNVTNACGSAQGTATVNAGATPSITALSTHAVLCPGDVATLSLSGSTGTATIWSTGDVTPTTTVNTVGTYTVRISNECGVSNTASITLSALPIPTLNVSPTSTLQCNGTTATLTATSNINNYDWGTLGTASSATVNAAGIYTVTSTNVCGSDSKTVAVTTNTTPSFALSASNTTLCSNGTVTLSIPTTTDNIVWNNGLAPTITNTVNLSGVYSVTVSNACGQDVQSQTITVIPDATISVTPNSANLCAGASATLTATSNESDFVWQDGIGLTIATNTSVIIVSNTDVYHVSVSNQCNSASASSTVSVGGALTLNASATSTTICNAIPETLTANGISGSVYTWDNGVTSFTTSVNTTTINTGGTYTVSGLTSCGTVSTSIELIALQIPTISISPSATLLCNGVTATLTATSNVNDYDWGTTLGTANTITVNTSGTYSVTSTNACGTHSTSVIIITNTSPNYTITTSSNTLCVGGTATLSVPATTNTILWSDGTGGTSIVVTPTLTSIYTVTVTNVDCGSLMQSETITVTPVPTISVTPTNVNICPGATATLQATSNITGNYVWSNSAGVMATTASSIITALQDTYTVSILNNCGTGTVTSTVTVGAALTLTANASSTLICNSLAVTLTANGSLATNYNWNNGTTSFNTSVNTTTFNAAGIYTVTGTTGCGDASTTFTLQANNSPNLTVNTTNTVLCNNATVNLIASSTANTYTWSPNTNNTATLNVNTAGIYTVATSNNCGIKTQTITVTSLTTPALTITASSQTICPNSLATLTVTGGTGPYNWSNNTSITGSVVTSDANSVLVSQLNGACPTSTAQIIISTSTLSSIFSATPLSGVSPLDVSFTNNSVGATSYTWNFGNGNGATTQAVSNQTYTVVGNYIVTLTVSDGICNGLTSTQTITVLESDPELIIPNVFTPNNDTINELFKVNFIKVTDFNAVIFNRWGTQLFSWSDIKTGWDGKSGGSDVPDGTYFYIINATTVNGTELKKQGSFLLFR